MEDYEIQEAYDVLVFRINQVIYELLTEKSDPKDINAEIIEIADEADSKLIGNEELKTEIFDRLLDVKIKARQLQ